MELFFPEYEFQIGDVVRIMNDDRFKHDPFIIVNRIFQDERSYSLRVNHLGHRNERLTGWYYNCKAVTTMGNDSYFRSIHCAGCDLEIWKWNDEDSAWRI